MSTPFFIYASALEKSPVPIPVLDVCGTMALVIVKSLAVHRLLWTGAVGQV
jgi:hypothetical protein